MATAETMTTQRLYKALLKSDLVDEATLKRSFSSVRVKHGGELPEDGKVVCDDLVAAGIITEWQATHLMQGRWRGFFLGKYKLFKLLGAGGMGSVYLSEHTVMNKRVAIKVLPKEGLNREKGLKNFQDEARMAAMLDHPNIVRTLDIDDVKGRHFIVMDFVDGSDLDRRVRKSGPLPIAEALDFFRQAALGLQYAHERGVLHRDVKPMNMLVSRDGVLKISDLGLARVRHEAVDEPTKRRVVGTADYIAPEQSRNSQTVDGRADLYSLGCTLYFMLVGKAPFAKGSAAERIAAHQLAPAPDLAAARDDCPEELVAIYDRLMAKQPEDRFQTATELLAAIDRLAPKVAASSGLHRQHGLAFPASPGGSSGVLLTGMGTHPGAADGMLDTLASGSLSDEALGSGLDLGALGDVGGSAGSVMLQKPAPEKNSDNRPLLIAGMALAVVAILVSIVMAIVASSGPKQPAIPLKKTEDGGGRVIIVQ